MLFLVWQAVALLFVCQCLGAFSPDAALYGMPADMVPIDLPEHAHDSLDVSISTQWDVLGPFQIGTRGIGLVGADPLEYLGGFRSLQYDPKARFRSSLPANGTATWSRVEAEGPMPSSDAVAASLSIAYDDVNWDFLKTIYGWSAVQYQAWARGSIEVHGDLTQDVILYTDAVMEYWVDGVLYFGGDAFTFRTAPPVLHLEPGKHTLDLRLYRDVRAFGGINTPTIDVTIQIQNTSGTLELSQPGVLLSAVVGGRLASPWAQVSLRNAGDIDVEVLDIELCSSNGTISGDFKGTVIVAGQTRPVPFKIDLSRSDASEIHCHVSYRSLGGDSKRQTIRISQALAQTSIQDPHKITFLHPGGIVSYAMLRPPVRNATCQADDQLPVLVGLHGAGVEAENPMVAHSFDNLTDLCAWILFPTGGTPWSSDDWHNWGFADVEAAIDSIPTWIKYLNWQGPGVDVDRWVVTGHSNGGQGTWYALTHRPDKVIAAAPLSGYASIQKYVPYELWQPADPRRTAIISASLNSYGHEMLLENAQGIPVLQQHGAIDDNVPAFHSRFLSQQLHLAGTESHYYEVPGRNHWWDGVMTTEPLIEFFRSQTTSNSTSTPVYLENFSIVVGDAGDTGPKQGVRVLHLQDPGQYGRVEVQGHILRTSNVVSLEFDGSRVCNMDVSIDGVDVTLSRERVARYTRVSGIWQEASAPDAAVVVRQGRQLGSMMAILRSQGPFLIRYHDDNAASVALQISRNFHQYFNGDSRIFKGHIDTKSVSGNVVTVVMSNELDAGASLEFPIQVSEEGVRVRDSLGNTRDYSSAASRLAAAFLRPLSGERLELVVWGSDKQGLAQAARLVPTVTGVGQPDFVVLGESASWRGVEGALALGFLDHFWRVSPSSVIS